MLRRNQTIRPTTTTQEMTLARGRIQRSPSARSRLKVDREDNQELNRPYTSPRTRSASPVARSPRSIGELPLKKLSNIYAKIVTQLEMVKDLSENRLNETENILDLRRQLQRADEFSIRFSRNNLYDTKRLLNEIKNMLVPYPFENMSPVEARTLSKKIILAYQAASQSLQIYINYVKNPGNLEVPDKISELVLLIAELLLCCEQLSLSSGEVHLQHDAVKICNELLAVLKSKPPVGEYLDIKQEVLTRKKHKKSVPQPEDATKLKNLSMYKARPGVKGKPDMPARKKAGLSCLLGNVNKKSNKKEEKMARITHEIYTQKMNPKPVRPFGNKNVKFDQTDQTDRGVKENATGKKPPKKSRYFTPREVRSQDDDVETMVQTIDDDDFVSTVLGFFR
ncbi:hypothetical protein RUM43_006623 [Polyplax serrata]|uniref:Uncharacterized protein n=1 Tax=Polyplax serrata TaxID=468196 RepID=A0AAN8NSC9_POLSC